MMTEESTQHKLDRVRRPRVQITYDVETGGAIQKKELPFVVGILADLSGTPEDAPISYKQRKFVDIDRDNFNTVLASISPRLPLRVENKLANDGSLLNPTLTFTKMDDFTPLNIVQQFEPLKKLFDARSRLSDLLAKLDGNDQLDSLLQDVSKNPDSLKQIKSQSQGVTPNA